MQALKIVDITLRDNTDNLLSFKEKIEIAKQLDSIGVDTIEFAPVTNVKADTLLLHTVAPLIKNCTVSCVTGLDEESLLNAWNGIKSSRKPRLHVMLPTSPVQMEYICHKKPNAILELTEKLVSKAKELCEDVEFSAMDATRSEPEFLYSVIRTAIEKGANNITICDTAGKMFPDEFYKLTKKIKENVPEILNVSFGSECSDDMGLGAASAIACAKAGATAAKVSVKGGNVPSVRTLAYILKARSDSVDVRSALDYTALDHVIENIEKIFKGQTAGMPSEIKGIFAPEFVLNKNDDIKTVSEYIKKLGYELSEEDVSKVYESFERLSEKKTITAREFEAIIASSALQVAPTYTLKSYVINSGNIITATAHIELVKDGNLLTGISIGDGPIDASFRAIEQITGHHFELDDFQIQSVTEGKEAMGHSLVKLRANGKLYSGQGISTDIVGASIRAYINALNKICFEEE